MINRERTNSVEQGSLVMRNLDGAAADEFAEDHLPGAVSIPLRQIDKEARAALDPQRPVIVYCWDAA